MTLSQRMPLCRETMLHLGMTLPPETALLLQMLLNQGMTMQPEVMLAPKGRPDGVR